LSDPEAPNIDHVFPVSLGGKDSEDNVRLAHRLCNMRKSNKVIKNVSTRAQRKSFEGNAEAA
jgi:5-methylcytosine-specific restriction endonuclease McrA